MGGCCCCCCCSSKGTEPSSAPTYYYYPRVSEEHVPLSSHRPVSAFSTGLLVDTNLDTSSPDTYRSPPAPIPYNIAVGRPHSPPVAQEMCGNKGDVAVQTTYSDSAQEAAGGGPQDPSTKLEDLKDCKVQADSKIDVAKQSEEEDVCPICLDEYDPENPKTTTKCEHHFHLGCILEWMERSDACPVCDQEMIFDPAID